MSNLIKSGRVVSLEDLKKLEYVRKYVLPTQNISVADGESEGNCSIDVETQTMKETILRDAEVAARQIVDDARETAERIREVAREEAEAWWRERRESDDDVREEARQAGYEEGYRAGAEEAGRLLSSQWSDKLSEASAIVRLGYETKESTIAEAELFVVELSCEIAGKLIGERLADKPELAVRMYAGALARRKERGVITLCVAPTQFGFAQSAKDELMLALDSQAELQIVPDVSIGEGGCIVRSTFGTIDATIDAQLAVVKEELLRIAAHSREEAVTDGGA